MEIKATDSVRARLEKLRIVRENEIPVQQQKMESFADSFCKSVESISVRSRANALSQGELSIFFILFGKEMGVKLVTVATYDTVIDIRMVCEVTIRVLKWVAIKTQNGWKLGELKARLRVAEDELVKTLAVKTRKEAKRLTIIDSIATSKSRIEELRNTLQDCKARRDEYATIISQQSLVLSSSERKETQESECRNEIQEAISWYKRVLDFHIEGGYGVKFSFKKINIDNPDEEYSFTIRHANDTYMLLDCNPSLPDIKELIHELNKTNGLFKLVRIMRRRFQEAAAEGSGAPALSLHQGSSIISTSAPGLSSSTERSDSSTEEINMDEVEETNKHSKNILPRKKPAIHSSGSAFSLRRSPRFKVDGLSLLLPNCFATNVDYAIMGPDLYICQNFSDYSEGSISYK
ncbi:putative kinetochore protein SPC25 [Cucumis melo var. makuwa]|uniref:Kinetochore protein SPC25 n=1 Tax=Cucumis melo var. makuwa TaxID=1194695 RepID=A0A5A7UUK0_CUCMM|nr:putative kinetochore protein SPC25 [Cucumis melo var. makuwa]